MVVGVAGRPCEVTSGVAVCTPGSRRGAGLGGGHAGAERPEVGGWQCHESGAGFSSDLFRTSQVLDPGPSNTIPPQFCNMSAPPEFGCCVT